MSLQNAQSEDPQSSLLGRPDDNGAPATVRSPVAAQQDASPARVLWAYVRHELLYICWALMDVALIAPLALGFIFWTRDWPLGAFVAWLFLVLLIPFNLSRLMSIAGVALRRQRNLIMISFALAFFLGVRSFLFQPQSLFDFSWLGALAGQIVNQPGQLWRREVALFILLAILWARGLALTGRYVAVTEIGFRLRLGGLFFVPIIIILNIVPGTANALPFVMLFFLAALVAVAVSRAEEVAQQETARTYPMSPGWVGSVLLTSLSIVSAAALVALAISGEGLQLLAQWLSPLWNAFAFGSMAAITTATYLMLFLLEPFMGLMRVLGRMIAGIGFIQEGAELPEFAPAPAEQLLLELGDPQSSVYLWFNRSAVGVLVLLGLLVVFVALRRYFRHRELSFGMAQRGPAAAVAEDHEEGLAQRLLDRFGRWRRWRAAATVRQLYRSMCLEAAGQGHPRDPSQTPFEYLPALFEVWPEGPEEVRLITDAYVRVRYGEAPETAEELEEIRQAWQRLLDSVAHSVDSRARESGVDKRRRGSA